MFEGSCLAMLCVHVLLDGDIFGGSMAEFAAVVARQMGEEEKLVMIVGPRSNADVVVLREVRRQPSTVCAQAMCATSAASCP